MSAIVYRCAREVFWFGEDLTTQCVGPAGHRGLHSDGLWWFTDDGIRAPQDDVDRCRTYEVDGEPIRVRGGEPLTSEGEAALAEVVRAAKSLITPEMAERQEAAMVRYRERLQRLAIRR
jgi:hypothetical protein